MITASQEKDQAKENGKNNSSRKQKEKHRKVNIPQDRAYLCPICYHRPAFFFRQVILNPSLLCFRGSSAWTVVLVKHPWTGLLFNLALTQKKRWRLHFVLGVWHEFLSWGILFVSLCQSFSPPGGAPSLIAGLFVGILAGYGAYRVSNDKRDVKVSLCK